MALTRLGFGATGRSAFDPPIELRFVDLFMILLTGFIFITVVLSLFAALGGRGGEEVRPPEIYTTAVPEAITARKYAVTLAAGGGSGGYHWSLVSNLPEGLRLSQDGVINGIPKYSGTTMARVLVADKSGREASKDLELAVLPPIQSVDRSARTIRVLADAMLPDGQELSQYRYTLTASGGVAPYSWEPKDSLPKGLSISRGGDLTGKPENANTNTFQLSVRDAVGTVAVQGFHLYVAPRPPSAWRAIFYWIVVGAWLFYLWRVVWTGGYTPGIKSWFENRRTRNS